MRTRCKLKFGQALIKFLGTGDSTIKFIGWPLRNWQRSHSRWKFRLLAVESWVAIDMIKLNILARKIFASRIV
jgi:hypothetical protein